MMYTPEQHKQHCSYALGHKCTEANEFNLPLLRKAIEWAKAEAALENNGQWDQGTWRRVEACGTKYCVAGYVCETMGERWHPEYPQWVMDAETGNDVIPGQVAAQHLGLYECEAAQLFRGDNSIHMVLDYARAFAARRGEELGL